MNKIEQLFADFCSYTLTLGRLDPESPWWSTSWALAFPATVNGSTSAWVDPTSWSGWSGSLGEVETRSVKGSGTNINRGWMRETDPWACFKTADFLVYARFGLVGVLPCSEASSGVASVWASAGTGEVMQGPGTILVNGKIIKLSRPTIRNNSWRPTFYFWRGQREYWK